MLTKFIKLAGLALVIAFIVSMGASYFIQTNNANTLKTDELNILLDDVESLVAENYAELAKIRTQIDKEYLEKTRAFAEMIKIKPEILDDYDLLCKIQDELGVDELHVCDENGVLLWGTVKDYYGFDFATGEQTVPFLAALTDKNFELAQDPQPNGATGVYFQYIGVSRYDKTGIVQIGMRPERLEEALAEASPANMLNNIKLNQDTRILLINPDENVVLGDSRKILQDKSIDIDFKVGTGFSTLDGQKVFWTARIIDGNLAVSIITQDSMYSARNQSLVVVAVTNLFIFLILLFIIAALVSRQFVQPIIDITDNMSKIGDGNFNVRVQVYTSKEFKDLSDGINGMVDNIKKMLENSENVNNRIKYVVKDIEKSVVSVEQTTSELFNESNSLTISVNNQNTAVEEISVLLENVSKNTVQNADNAGNASRSSGNALANANIGRSKMTEMVTAVGDIDRASQDISKVIKTIDDIAFQTNILALNAAVEAARAGSAGKGFAIVADEVRNLASKSAEAAKQTESLITTSISKSQTGVKIANETSAKILEVVENINQSAELIDNIAKSSEIQTNAVGQLSEKLDTIVKSIAETSVSATKVTEESEKLQVNSKDIISLINELSDIG